MPLYCGVNGVRREIKGLYTGVSGVRKELTEIWAAEGGVKKMVYQAVKGTPISKLSVGSLVKVKENGVLQEYKIVHKGKPSSSYDNSCNGAWLLRKDCIEERVMNTVNSNIYESSSLHRWLNSNMINKYSSEFRSIVRTVKIPYRKGGGRGTDLTGENGLQCRVFLLSCSECGLDGLVNTTQDGSKLLYFQSGESESANNFRVAYFQSTPTVWWVRSLITTGYTAVRVIGDNGSPGLVTVDSSTFFGVRPAIVVPLDVLVADDGTIVV